MIKIARSDGSVVIDTKLDTSGFSKGVTNMQVQLGKLGSAVKRLGAAIGLVFGIREIVLFGKESSEAAVNLESALRGLQSIVEGQGRSFAAAQQFVEEYTQDGLIPATNAITAYKNLASRGYDDSQIRQVMTALKDASAFARQASMTMGDAVQSATEGLKNENSILVDNAGVTKNVAKMWEEYAASIGTTANKLTQQQKIQAEVNGILEETQYQTGDAAIVANALSGQLQQLAFRFNDLKVAVGNIVNPILQRVLPVVNTAITALTRLANVFATVISLIFGKVETSGTSTADTMADVADEYSTAAGAAEDYGDSAAAAGKAAKSSLAGFDEINKLQANSGSGSGSASGVPGGGSSANISTTADTEVEDTISLKLQAMADKINELVKPLKQIDFTPAVEAFGRLREAIEPITRKLFDGLEWAWYNILVPLAEWTIEDLLPAFLDLASASLDFLNVAIEGLQPLGVWLWDEFLKPMAEWTGGVIVDSINGFADALTKISDWIGEHQEGINNFVILLGSIAGTFAVLPVLLGVASAIKDILLLAGGAQIAMSPFLAIISSWVARIGMAFSGIGAWITGTLFPGISAALTTIASALGISVGWVVAIVAAVGAAVAAIIIYWDEIVVAASTAWETVKGVWDKVVKFFTDLWDDVTELASEAWEGITEFFAPAVDWFEDLLNSIGQTFEDIFYNIGIIASGCWEIVKRAWDIASSWFGDTVIQPIADFFEETWENVTSWASDAWEGIKEVFGNVATFFGDIFEDAWEKVVKVFSIGGEIFTDIKDGILTAFKKVVNGIIGGLNSVISVPFDGINTALEKIRDISILGLTPFSGLKTVSVPKIPYLAQGAVIPPNAPFMAVVGDQKHGTNVEAPLDTIKQALAEVMAMQGTGDINITFTGDLAALARVLKPVIDKENRRVGGSLVKGV